VPRPRFDTLEPHRRRGILEGAAAAFAHGGLHGASLNQILSATGVSKGVFYYYFDDKMDLYGTVVEDAIRRFEAVFAKHPAAEDLSAADYWECLEASYRDLFAFSEENAAVVGLVKTLPDLTPGEVARLGVDLRCLSWLERYLQRGQALGVIRDDLPMDVLTGLASAVDSAMGQWLFGDPGPDLDALVQGASKVVGMHRRVLGADVRFSEDRAARPVRDEKGGLQERCGNE